MVTSNADRIPVEFAQRLINGGGRHMVLPGRLVAEAGDEVLEEIRR